MFFISVLLLFETRLEAHFSEGPKFVKWRKMAADRNQWRAISGSKTPSATKETSISPDMTSGLCFDTATYHREYKNLNGNFR
jgi:hypothetical protein